MSWIFEKVAGPYNGPTAGVVWDGTSVLFAVPDEGRIMRFDPATSAVKEARCFTNRTSGLAIGNAGELFGCQEGSRRMVEFCPDGSAAVMATNVDGLRHNFPSDSLVDRSGRIWFADCHSKVRSFGPQMLPPLPHASILRMDRDPTTHHWRIRRVTHDTTAPRALLLSATESTLYVAEGDINSPVRELRAYAIADDGSAGQHAVLHNFNADYRGAQRGIEGMCLDTAGNIIACAGSRKTGPGPLVYVFSAKGRIVETHEFPDDEPMRCAFGGDLADLYVTSAAGNLWRAKGTSHQGFRRAV